MLKPPVTLDTLMKEWSQDKIVDGTELEKEILKQDMTLMVDGFLVD